MGIVYTYVHAHTYILESDAQGGTHPCMIPRLETRPPLPALCCISQDSHEKPVGDVYIHVYIYL